MERVSLYEEYRLIERSESEINGAWKGAHLLLFFMAFVFGSFCTFCFHMLMYLFDEKCVLFPKLLSLTSLRHNVIYEFIPSDKETADMLPVDFVGTQWLEKSACYLPTYVPLVSGIFGLVWTTMFLMCSTGSRNLTGLQRPWRVLLPIFVFSLAMGGLCVYSSSVTHYGLNELCIKLGEITGSATCTYTVNVATLAYERRIRGVYQAIRLTIFSAWLHTICWLLSALLIAIRVLLVIDFQLVRINADLIGDIDKMLERQEKQIRTVSPDHWLHDEQSSKTSLLSAKNNKKQQLRRTFAGTQTEGTAEDDEVEVIYKGKTDMLYESKYGDESSDQSLMPEEVYKVAKLAAYDKMQEDKHFIVKIVYDLVEKVIMPESMLSMDTLSEADDLEEENKVNEDKYQPFYRQVGKEKVTPKGVNFRKDASQSKLSNTKEARMIAKSISKALQNKLNEKLLELHISSAAGMQATTSRGSEHEYVSELNITDEMKDIIETKRASRQDSIEDVEDDGSTDLPKKSNLKHASVQTGEAKKKTASPRVQIAEPENEDKETETVEDAEKETQTGKKKEKQD